jgi:hypothetical protein
MKKCRDLDAKGDQRKQSDSDYFFQRSNLTPERSGTTSIKGMGALHSLTKLPSRCAHVGSESSAFCLSDPNQKR